MNITPLLVENHLGMSITILAGQNGAGKSRYLQTLAKHFAALDMPVVVICNTPFDRFQPMRGVKRISASQGKRLPSNVLKSAFISALQNGPTAFRALSKTLNYCGYGPEIGVRLVRPNWQNFKESLDFLYSDELREPINNIESAFAYAASVASNDIAWLDFSESNFTSLRQQSYAVLMKFEPLLRKLKALNKIELILRRRDGLLIPLDHASSGELTLIATLVFLSIEVKDNGIVLIDEPENSLHPEWQKQYIERLASLLFYFQPQIFIATHAPIIVSGAQTDPDIKLQLFHAKPDGIERLDASAKSVEGTLWQVFQTVTPQNHFISQTLSQELSELAAGTKSTQDVSEMITKMSKSSYDPRQIKFFEGAQRLANKVAEREDEKR